MVTPVQWFFTKAPVNILIVRTVRRCFRIGKMLLLLDIDPVEGAGHKKENIFP